MPPRKKVSTVHTPTPVESITHEDKRVNIPTADAHDFVGAASRETTQLRYPRDTTLDPQLVWTGKDDQDADDLVVEAPPLYIQEKVDPRVLVENLRRTADRPEDEPELTLFDDFDGLDEWESVEYYKHTANWSNRLILGDSLQVMGSLAERENLRGQVQMIYLDPPYGIKFNSNWQTSTRERDTKDGKLEYATREVEQIKAFRDTWKLGIHSYLPYMRDRLLAARDLLTESGSIFVQIGDENSHLVRSLMDEVFGSRNFAGQIYFYKTSSESTGALPGAVDSLLLYAKNVVEMKFRPLRLEKRPGDRGAKQYVHLVDREVGDVRRMTPGEETGQEEISAEWDVCTLGPLTSMGRQAVRSMPYIFNGKAFPCPSNRHWSYDPSPGGEMDRLAGVGRIRESGKSIRSILLLNDNPMTNLDNVWMDTGTGSFTEDQIYVVQTGQKVLRRCILMSTDPGDLVLDPTCGAGTTAFVAEHWGRRWITIDTSRVALTLARQRLMGARYPHYLLADSAEGRAKEAESSGRPASGDLASHDTHKGFVYKRVPHVTLKSIASNPDIVKGMSREEIDEAIARHAESEILYDQPYENPKKIRVAGPFTVESLSPHRVADDFGDQPASETGADFDSTTTFEQMLLDNLRRSGVQNGRKAERFEFDEVRLVPGKYLAARAIPRGNLVEQSVAVSIGPRYGTVGSDWIKSAAREAMRGKGHDVLLVLGFAFDPRALETVEEFKIDSSDGFAVQTEHELGSIRVLLVRMNADLAMGESLLKKSKAANLFTVFGEPDVAPPQWTDDGWVVSIRGFDVYNPVTGEVRAGGEDDIAMWMIDTDYDEESFFVRHAYFLGADPYERLRKALKADIDEAAWDSLNSSTSRPFPHPSTDKIAVKVINHYGDELLTVMDLPAPPTGERQ